MLLPLLCGILALLLGLLLSAAEGWCARPRLSCRHAKAGLSALVLTCLVAAPSVLNCHVAALWCWHRPLRECFFVVLMELSGTNIDLHTRAEEQDHPETHAARQPPPLARTCTMVAPTFLIMITGCARQFVERPPRLAQAKLVAAFVGVVAIALFCIVLAVMGGPLMAPFVTIANLDSPTGVPPPHTRVIDQYVSARSLLTAALAYLHVRVAPCTDATRGIRLAIDQCGASIPSITFGSGGADLSPCVRPCAAPPRPLPRGRRAPHSVHFLTPGPSARTAATRRRRGRGVLRIAHRARIRQARAAAIRGAAVRSRTHLGSYQKGGYSASTQKTASSPDFGTKTNPNKLQRKTEAGKRKTTRRGSVSPPLSHP